MHKWEDQIQKSKKGHLTETNAREGDQMSRVKQSFFTEALAAASRSPRHVPTSHQPLNLNWPFHQINPNVWARRSTICSLPCFHSADPQLQIFPSKRNPHPPAEVGVAKCDSQIYQYTNTSTMSTVFIVLEPHYRVILQYYIVVILQYLVSL